MTKEIPDAEILEETPPDAAPQPKTITGIFAATYRALDCAAKLGNAVHDTASDAEGIAKLATDLKAALHAVPQSDLDALVRNVTMTYRNLESLFITGVAFEREAPGVVVKVTLKFGENDVTLMAPFDDDGKQLLLDDLRRAVGEIIVKTPKLILPH